MRSCVHAPIFLLWRDLLNVCHMPIFKIKPHTPRSLYSAKSYNQDTHISLRLSDKGYENLSKYRKRHFLQNQHNIISRTEQNHFVLSQYIYRFIIVLQIEVHTFNFVFQTKSYNFLYCYNKSFKIP